MQRLPAIICTEPIHVLRYGAFAGIAIVLLEGIGYGYGEVTQRLLISVRVRGSSSLWWLDRGFRFASWILMFFGQRDIPSGRTVGCMTKVEGGDHRFCFTRLGGSGTSRPLRLSIGMGCSTCVVVCCCFCC